MKKNISKIINKINLMFLLLSLYLLPSIAFAEGKDLKYIAGIVTDYLRIGIYLIISLAVVTFIWNIYKYFFRESEKTEAGKYVLYSTIGFFVMLSFWGLVVILSNSLDLPKERPQWPFNTSTTNNSFTQPMQVGNTNTDNSFTQPMQVGN